MPSADTLVPYHHGDLKSALVQAALALLAETQNWDFSLREVARRANVSHTAPYNHFASKQELLAFVASAGYDLLRQQMQDAAAGAETPAVALRRIGVAYVRFGVTHPAHYRLMFGTAFGTERGNDRPSPLRESATAAYGVLRDTVQRGVAEGHFALPEESEDGLNAAVLAAWSLVHGLTLLLLDGLAGAPVSADGLAVEQIAEQVTGTLLRGIQAQKE